MFETRILTSKIKLLIKLLILRPKQALKPFLEQKKWILDVHKANS